jgi:hypothetical protein
MPHVKYVVVELVELHFKSMQIRPDRKYLWQWEMVGLIQEEEQNLWLKKLPGMFSCG